MRDPSPQTTSVDLSAREHLALERYAQEHGLTVDEAASELAHQELLIRVGALTQPGARVLPFRRR